MGKGALIAILLIAILAIGGIYAYLSLVEEERPTPTPTPTKPPKPTKTPKPSPSPTPSPTPTPSQGEISIYDMFDLTRVSYYKYRVVTVAQGQTMEYIISYSVKSGNLEGRSCWIYEIEITNQMTFKYRVWLDKDTFECIKTEMAIGEDIWQTTPCGKVPTGTVEVSEGAKVDIKVIGHETITVPAGTFSCTVYEVSTKSGKAAYWVADNVPVPVKWETTAEQVTVTGELMEWG